MLTIASTTFAIDYVSVEERLGRSVATYLPAHAERRHARDDAQRQQVKLLFFVGFVICKTEATQHPHSTCEIFRVCHCSMIHCKYLHLDMTEGLRLKAID